LNMNKNSDLLHALFNEARQWPYRAGHWNIMVVSERLQRLLEDISVRVIYPVLGARM
jgi:hypothetical protein